ncbi:MAG: hypothetical protein M1270_06110 [Gammaproteobacteria bacterium]|nr:hypothetical protein [Gammaproteobacteria bacterium]
MQKLVQLVLHGNVIAHADAMDMTTINVRTSDWNTVTTRERLNVLLGVNVNHD